VVKISGVEDRDAAEAIKGLDLYVSRGSLPKLDEGEFYFSDLIGLDAVNLNGSLIGKVKSVDNFGAGNVMELEMRDGNFRSLPFSLDVVPVVDIAGGRVVVKPPTELDIEDAADAMEIG
jgi:16S rRNA processing protein RimM